MTLEYVSLEEVCRPKQWKTISKSNLLDSGYPVYGANGKIGFYNEFTHEQETVLITCRGATCGTLNICEPKSYVNGNAMALDSLSSDFNHKFLYYYLKFRGLEDTITGSAQPQITRQSLKKVKVPKLSLGEQERVASNLERIDQLLELKDKSIELALKLEESLFVKCFGDPIKNDKGWNVEDLKNIVIDFKYGSSAKANGEDLPILRIPNVVGRNILLDDMKYVDLKDSEKDKLLLKKGDILFVRTNGNRRYIGRSAVFDLEGEYVYASYLIRARLKNELIDPYFLTSMLRVSSMREYILTKSSTTAGQFNINTQGLGSLRVIVPPMEEQIAFKSILNKVNTLLGQQKTSHKDLEKLVISVLEKTFKDLSIVAA